MGLLPRRRRPPGSDRAAELRAHYGLDFPDELFWLWGFCCEHNPERPRAALGDAEIQLCGPFDVLAGDLDGRPRPRAPVVMHWRFYLDPPELFTIAGGHTDGLHWGYWFDAPGRLEPVIASYYSRDAYEIAEDGSSLFAVFIRELERRIESHREYLEDDPGHAAHYRAAIAATEDTVEAMRRYRQRAGLTFTPRPAVARRETFDRMGLWVDDDPADLVGAPRQLWQRADNGDGAALLDIAASALDAGRPGAALLITRAVWTFEGSRPQHPAAAALAARIYDALDRPALAAVSRAQVEHRAQPLVDVIGES